jgi:hypothetical protein
MAVFAAFATAPLDDPAGSEHTDAPEVLWP